MIGLVIWSDEAEKKAVFWCEDHGDLAYYNAELDNRRFPPHLRPGDMVRFDVNCVQNIRRAQNAELVSRRTCTGIQDELRQRAATRDNAAAQDAWDGSNVVRFPAPVAAAG